MNIRIALVLIVFAVGCQKTRADYRDDIAHAVCAKMQTCGKVGQDGRFANMDDCQTKMRDRYNSMWPAKKCTGTIDHQKFGQCRTRAVTNACDGNLLDGVSFRMECGAGDVCIAEPPSNNPPK